MSNGTRNENNKGVYKSKVDEDVIKVDLAFLKMILPRLKSLKDYESKSLYLMIIIIGLLFYTLAYVFFYGYYFGGEAKNIQSVLQVAINPVPFNFKSLTMLGIFFVLIVIAFINITIKISESLNGNSKIVVIDMLLLIITFIFVHACFTIVFIGKLDLKIEYIKIWIIPMFLIIYFSFLNSGKFANIIYGLFTAIDANFILIIVASTFRLDISALSNNGIFITLWVIFSVIIALINLEKIVLYFNYFLFLYIIFCILFKVNNIISINSLLVSLISVIFILFSCKIYHFIKNMIYKNYNKIRTTIIYKSLSLVKRYVVKNAIVKIIKLIRDRYKNLLLPIFIVVVVSSAYYTTYSLGQEMSLNMSQNSYDEISYFSNDKTGQENKIIGSIVSYKDSVFYISNMNRELVTIKSNEVNTKPYVNK